VTGRSRPAKMTTQERVAEIGVIGVCWQPQPRATRVALLTVNDRRSL
jgi:hypothetical protein